MPISTVGYYLKRWQFTSNIAGKVINHARQTILKVNEQFIELLSNIRQKAYDVSLE
jgi:hypothetical protein